ncbi:MAG TPA: IS66 family transposase [Acidimicrobiales bacterium]|nr:IS66 family transposase [Acidimicrobiales bacterium]
MTSGDAAGLSHAELVELVVELSHRVEALAADNERLRAENQRLRAEVAKNSGNSSKPSSRDPAAERKRQAEERQAKKARAAGGKKRRPGKQPGTKGNTLEMTEAPDEVIVHAPEACSGCGAGLGEAEVTAVARRQVIDIPVPAPVVTEHRTQTRRCGCCGQESTAAFPEAVRAPVSYGPRVRAIVVYLLARQHIPVQRSAEAMAELFGIEMATGTVDAIYNDAARRLRGFIAALAAWLRSLPVLHADETTDRIGTATCWMHVVSTGLYTLIHASVTRGTDAIVEAGVLISYRGVIVHDRLALYWKLKKARHGLCAAHLLRDLASVAEVATQTAWAAGLAALLVEINAACDAARAGGHKALAPTRQRTFRSRYDALVADGIAANPAPAPGRKRTSLQRQSFNLATAFDDHRQAILRYMYDLEVSFTNNQAERDLRPVKIHRKISSCFRSQAGAERFAHVRSYLSTTRKNDVGALDALTRLFNGDPWMPPQAA